MLNKTLIYIFVVNKTYLYIMTIGAYSRIIVALLNNNRC